MATEANLVNKDVSARSGIAELDIIAPSFSGTGKNIQNFPGVITHQICKTALVDDLTINNFTSPTVINVFPVDTASLAINVGGFTCSSSGIIVPETGTYLFLANIHVYSTIRGANPAVSVAINGSESVENVGSGMITNLHGQLEASAHLDTVLELTSGDEIGLAFTRVNVSGQVQLYGASSSVTLYRIS